MLRLIVFLTLVVFPAAAHHASEPLLRQVMVDRGWLSTVVTVRLPATLLYAPAAAARENPGERIDAPLLVAAQQDGIWTYRIEPSAPTAGLAPLLEEAIRLTIGGRIPSLQSVTLHHLADAPPVGEARGSTLGNAPLGETLVEATYRAIGWGTVSVNFAVDKTELPPFVHLETVVIDGSTGDRSLHVGPLATPLRISGE